MAKVCCENQDINLYKNYTCHKKTAIFAFKTWNED